MPTKERAEKNNTLRQLLRRVAASGEPLSAPEDFDEVQWRRDLTTAEIRSAIGEIIAASEDVADLKSSGNNGAARRLADEIAEEWRPYLDPSPRRRTPADDIPDSDPRELGNAIARKR